MRAVIYARYSSDNQRDASIDDQIRLCRTKIAQEGWTLVATYSDRGLSGATPFRPGYQKLLEDARAGQFDVVVAEALDRLSRDQEDIAALHKRLAFSGIRIVTIAEGEISDLHVGLKGTMNALYLKDLAQKTRRGLEGRVRDGRSGGGLCYGYAVVKETDARGEPVRGGRRVNETEAAIVRRIFQEFAAGASPWAIARRLNAEGIDGPDGSVWRDTSIRGHQTRGTGLLNNELYIGRLVWNRLRYVKDPQTGKRLSRPNPPAQWVITEVPELRIVDRELWEAVKLRQQEIAGSATVQKVRAQAPWTKRRARHLLTGKVTCGGCGGPVVAIGRDYLACSNARELKTCEHRRGIRRAVLEELILDALRANLMQPDLVQAFVAEFHKEINRQSATQALDRTRLEKELAAVGRKLDGLIEAIAEGLRTPGTLAKLQELEDRKAKLEAELASAPPSVVRLHPRLADLYRDKVAHLAAALQDPLSRDEALGILRGLIEAVVLHLSDTGFAIELAGEIAGMVTLAANDKAAPEGAAVRAALRGSAMVVAGAGFEPATFRL